jgi:hypothetical protein
MDNDIFIQSEVDFDPKKHTYTSVQEGFEYTSVTRLLSSIQVPFDREATARRMATGIAAEEGGSAEDAYNDIIKGWNDSLKGSIDKGDYLHDGLEKFVKTGMVAEEELKKPVTFLSPILKEYYRFYPEVTLHSNDHKVAGRTDLILQRQKTKNSVFDFIDYKTNMSKGIVYDSIKRNTTPIKHYNRFLLPPFDYLEDCNYVIDSLQLSIYAFMAMTRLNLRVGKLRIIFFDNNFDGHIIPVPFMYQEAKMLCELNVSRKQLPEFNLMPKLIPDNVIHDIPKPYEPFDPANVRENW